MQGSRNSPVLGDAEVYLAHIGRDDYPKLKQHKQLFNMLLRRCGGMPVTDFDREKFCATIAFTSNLFREDFARELEDKTGVYVVVDFRQTFVDRKSLPPVGKYDKYDFNELSRRAKEQREYEKLVNDEPDYYYPTGKQQAG